MWINAKKTKITIIGKDIPEDEPDIMINGNVLERVDNFIYLGRLFTTDGKCEKEIKRRIQIAKSAFIRMKNIFANRRLNMNAKLRAVKCYIISTLLYDSENMDTFDSNGEKGWRAWRCGFIDASWESAGPRRWQALQWRKRSKKRVVRKWRLMMELKRRKLAYCGHIIRAGGLQSQLLLRQIEGRRRQREDRGRHGWRSWRDGGIGKKRRKWCDVRRTGWNGVTSVGYSSNGDRQIDWLNINRFAKSRLTGLGSAQF